MSVMSKQTRLPRTLVVLTSALLCSCSALDRLKNIGEQPALSAIENPTAQPGYKPVQMPMPAPQPAVYNPNSLWRNGWPARTARFAARPAMSAASAGGSLANSPFGRRSIEKSLVRITSPRASGRVTTAASMVSTAEPV